MKKWVLVLGRDIQRSDGLAYDDEKAADATRKRCQELWPERGPWALVVVVPEGASDAVH